MMAKLIPETQTDWARIDRLATPKSRADLADAQSALLGTGATWSQSSGMLSFEEAAMGSTFSTASSIGDTGCFAYPFVPMTSPRSRKLAKGRRAQLEKMAAANAARQPESPAQAPGSGGEGAAAGAGAAGGDSADVGAETAATSDGSGGAPTTIRPQTSYGELLYRSNQSALCAATDDAESVGSAGSGASFDVRSPRANRGSITARAPLAPQLPQLPSCSPRLRRTCGVYGVSPGRRPGTTGSGRRERVRAPDCGLHEHKPVPPMPVGLLDGAL